MYQVPQVALTVKCLPAKAGDLRDEGPIPGSGRAPRGGHGNPLQYSCLQNPQGQRSLAGYYRVAKSQAGLKRLSTHAVRCINFKH